MCFTVVLWTLRSPSGAARVTPTVVIALACGIVGVAAGAGSFLGGHYQIGQVNLAALAVIAPMLDSALVPPVFRIAGPAAGALAVVPLMAAHAGPRPAIVRITMWCTIAVSACTCVLMIVAREPFLEVDCLGYCGNNPWLVNPAPNLIHASQVMLGVSTIAWCLAVWHSRSAREEQRLVVVAGLVQLAAVLCAVAYLARGLPVDGAWSGLMTRAQLLVLTLILGVALLRQAAAVRMRRQVARLGFDLAQHGRLGHVDEWLRSVAGDPSLRLEYPNADERVSSARSEGIAGDGDRSDRAAMVVRLAGKTVAVIDHDPGSSDRLERAMSPLVAMAIDNDRLQARALALYDSLVESRRMIVQTGDAARRQLERDLHDGAQQRLLLLGMVVAAASEGASLTDRALCQSSVALATRALSELRLITNGPVPELLYHLGLVEALTALAEAAPLPVEIVVRTASWRMSPEVERAAYRVVASTVRQAALTNATHATVSVEKQDAIVLTITHDGHAPIDNAEAQDLVGAVRGQCHIGSELNGSVAMRIVLPCE